MHLRRCFMCIITVSFLFYLFLSVYLNFSLRSHDARNGVLFYQGLSFADRVPVQTKIKCTNEMTNFVFIKCMKCATETMASVLRRFGYLRNLTFVLPVKRNLYLGWPFPIELSDIRLSKFDYNILLEHSIYNGSFLQQIMPNNTMYITMIRNPWDHFKSTYNYFDVGEIGDVPNKSIETYLKNITYYESIYKSPEKNWRRHCVPEGFSITRNLLSHCLGFPLGFPAGREDISKNQGKLQSYINDLEERFSLVMIVDYFAESLVLLKRIMCWSFKDIVYHHSNMGNYKDSNLKSLKPEGEYYKIHRNWSNVDYMLFNHFNKTLWQKIKNEGPDFYEEVQQFRLIQLLVERFCFIENMWKFPNKYMTIPGSKFGKKFNITGEDCVLMNTYMLPLLWAKFYEIEGVSPEQFEDVEKRPKPLKGCSIR
ncbi:galactose-3-O-sulfotransferase 2-like [Ruditapes philippinarum]|uniref:galactose-3-O-sulfotransferase 2-like n=1 Tax=Ruditapes philippinarum TaxID=129788 RepID=UPI00295A844D|nr:galactose-3-O-sulfotransferase 2-like [Ruditapes philippinarum]